MIFRSLFIVFLTHGTLKLSDQLYPVGKTQMQRIRVFFLFAVDRSNPRVCNRSSRVYMYVSATRKHVRTRTQRWTKQRAVRCPVQASRDRKNVFFFFLSPHNTEQSFVFLCIFNFFAYFYSIITENTPKTRDTKMSTNSERARNLMFRSFVLFSARTCYEIQYLTYSPREPSAPADAHWLTFAPFTLDLLPLGATVVQSAIRYHRSTYRVLRWRISQVRIIPANIQLITSLRKIREKQDISKGILAFINLKVQCMCVANIAIFIYVAAGLSL